MFKQTRDKRGRYQEKIRPFIVFMLIGVTITGFYTMIWKPIILAQ